MAKFIATYDLKDSNPSPHWTFLEKATENGWDLWAKASDGRWYRLPNTTLIGEFQTRDTAVQALKQTRASTEEELGRKVTMEKWIVAEYSGATFNSDDTQPG